MVIAIVSIIFSGCDIDNNKYNNITNANDIYKLALDFDCNKGMRMMGYKNGGLQGSESFYCDEFIDSSKEDIATWLAYGISGTTAEYDTKTQMVTITTPEYRGIADIYGGQYYYANFYEVYIFYTKTKIKL